MYQGGSKDVLLKLVSTNKSLAIEPRNNMRRDASALKGAARYLTQEELTTSHVRAWKPAFQVCLIFLGYIG